MMDLPKYPDSRPVELRDRELLQNLFNALQPTVSELSFANIFLFRHVHEYRLSSVDSALVLSGCGYDGAPYFLPPLSGDIGAAARRLLHEGNMLYGADELFIVDHLSGGNYNCSEDRDNADYLYLRGELADLPGKRLHKKRNRVSYFTSRHGYSIEPFSKKHLQSSLALLDDWWRVRGDKAGRSLYAESEATREGLELADELGLFGVVVLTKEGVCAFALGEKLNDQTFVCHFEKADPFMEGAAQLVNMEFARSLSAQYVYLNREQDLGESSLRRAKSSYHPERMIMKFRVTLTA